MGWCVESRERLVSHVSDPDTPSLVQMILTGLSGQTGKKGFVS